MNLPEQLERPMYEAVMKVIANCGGRWKRGTGHVFESDPRIKLGLALDTGVALDEKKKFQAFYTPIHLARMMVQMASVSGHKVLEPSAGAGMLVEACLQAGATQVDCIEINYEMRQKLIGPKRAVHITDFLLVTGPKEHYKRIVMNPPFTKKQDLKHIGHAFHMLAPGGRLVAISQANRTEKEFRDLVGNTVGIDLYPIDPGEFKESGTNIATQIVVIDK